jgi:gluconolactonase
MSIRTIAAAIGFTEGPVWHQTRGLLVASMSRGLLYRIDLGGADPEVAADTGGGPNGLATGPDGTVWVAQNGGATIKSRSERPARPGLQAVRSADVEDVLTVGPVAPNDLVIGADGQIWFTDPTATPPCVRTFDLENGRLRRAIEGIEFPNGLAFGLDPEELFVADSRTGDLLRYRVVRGAVHGPAVFASAPGGGPDGVAFDADGNLYVALFDADEIAVFDSGGERIASLSTGNGSRPTNCCFAGDDLATLVVTAASGGRVLALDGKYRGRSATPWLGSATQLRSPGAS